MCCHRLNINILVRSRSKRLAGHHRLFGVSPEERRNEEGPRALPTRGVFGSRDEQHGKMGNIARCTREFQELCNTKSAGIAGLLLMSTFFIVKDLSSWKVSGSLHN